MSKRYRAIVAQLEALVREMTDIAEVLPTIGAAETAEAIQKIITDSKG